MIKRIKLNIVNLIKNKKSDVYNKEIKERENQVDYLYTDISEYEYKLYELVKPFTMTSLERVVSLIRATNYILDNEIKGDFVECGVWKGGSSMIIAKILFDRAIKDRRLLLYDTFDGMVEPAEIDRTHDGILARKLMNEESKEQSVVWAYSPLEEVKSNIEKTGLNLGQVTFIKGDVSQTLLNNVPAEISLLRLDTDWYESTKLELERLFPRVTQNGVIIIDDYGHWEGCKQAVDEFLFKLEVPYFLNRIDYTGRLIIKK
jgi:O-methyltransferase